MTSGNEGAELPQLRGATLIIVAFALALGTFMQVLDSTIANVSLPTIAGNLGVSSDSATWVITSFSVANGVAVPLTGWLMGRFGVVRTFCASILLFTFASFLCGIAWSLNSLIIFRIFQGAVSGPMIPGSQALLVAVFPPEKRSSALGIWSLTTLTAPIAGPLLGGYISDNYHWSWIFQINVPVGLLCAFICWRILASRETAIRKLPIDMIGIALLILWVGALQVMLDLGKDADWFSSSLIVILAVIAAIGFLAWLIWEFTDAHPAVNLRLFKDRNFAFGVLALCMVYAVFFGNSLLLPLWLQTQLGYTASWAGLVSAPSGVVAVLFTPLMARLSGRVDARWMATFSFVAFSASYFMRAGYTTDASFWDLALPIFVAGLALSCFFLSLVTIQLNSIAPDDMPSASGISNFARITSGSFAVSLMSTAWDRREAIHQARLADHVAQTSPGYQYASEKLSHLGLTDLQAAEIMYRQMIHQAYLLSSIDLFWLSGCISLLMIVFVWFTTAAKNDGKAISPE